MKKVCTIFAIPIYPYARPNIFTDEGSTGVYNFTNPDEAKDADNRGATASSLAILLSGTTHRV
jgi:hypothetical protein